VARSAAAASHEREREREGPSDVSGKYCEGVTRAVAAAATRFETCSSSTAAAAWGASSHY
jgi:hypothetical protein